jgi:hypothetical protein
MYYNFGVDSASNRNEYLEFSWRYSAATCKADDLTAIYEAIV